MRVHVRYFAAAKAAVGAGEETVVLPAGSLVRDLVADAVGRAAGRASFELRAPGTDPADVFARCAFLLDGQTVDDSAPLADGSRLDVLPPFAGG